MFYWGTSLGSFLLLLLFLWWLILLILSYSTFFDILSGDLHIWSSSQWPSSGCCSHWILPHLLSGTCLFLSLWLLYLVYFEACVYLLLSWNPTVLLLAHFLLLYLVCAHTRILHPPWYVHMHMLRCILAATWLCLLKYWSVANVWHPDIICFTVSSWIWHILHLPMWPSFMMCLLWYCGRLFPGLVCSMLFCLNLFYWLHQNVIIFFMWMLSVSTYYILKGNGAIYLG